MVKRIIILLFVFSSILSFGQANRFAGFGYKSTCDVDAQKFIDSSGITSQTEKDAVCVFVKQLKDSSIWTKLIAAYPMLGSSATTCKWNLVNPVNSDGAYRLTFAGGWTFSSTGAKPNGTNGLATTYFNPSTSGTITSQAFGYDSRTNSGSSYIDFGVDNNVNNIYGYIWYINNRVYSSIYSASYVQPTTTRSNYFYVVSLQSTTLGVYDNGISVSSSTLAISSRYNGNITFGLGGRECDLFFISTGLSSSEVATLNRILQTFKTALSR